MYWLQFIDINDFLCSPDLDPDTDPRKNWTPDIGPLEKVDLGLLLLFIYLLLTISKNFTIKKIHNVSSTIGGVPIKVNNLKCVT